MSLRNLEEMMQERGVTVDHPTIHRWILRLMPVLERTFRKRKAIGGTSWRMDETYVKVSGQWKYQYRAVDKAGNTGDFLLTAKRDRAAARRFLARAIEGQRPSSDRYDRPERRQYAKLEAYLVSDVLKTSAP